MCFSRYIQWLYRFGVCGHHAASSAPYRQDGGRQALHPHQPQEDQRGGVHPPAPDSGTDIRPLQHHGRDTKPVFPLPSRDEMWFEIHELGVAIGREENLSYHQARHSFGTFLISEGIPIESIAKMMGHSGIRTTQRYAEVTDKKISKDMDNLMAVRMMYGTGKWYKRQELPKETDFDNGQIG